jgi:Zn-dependent protease with chaperone function
MTTFIRKAVRLAGGQASYVFGIFPHYQTLLALIITSAAIAGATALVATTASILPVMAATVGAAFINFWFSREIQSAMLGLTPTSAYVKNERGEDVEQDWTYDIGLKNHNGEKVQYNLAMAMDHLRGVINARYPSETPLPPIRLGTFAEHHYKLVVTGRNPGKSMIALANPGVAHTFKGKTREFNALMLQALAQIKLRATFSGMVVGMILDFGQLLQSFKTHDFLPFKILGLMVAPFAQLLINAMSRTNAYYRADRIVAECGYGDDLIKALDVLNQPNNVARVNTHREELPIGPEPTTRLGRMHRRIDDVLRADSYPGEDKTGWVLLQAIDNAVLRFAFFFKELFSAAPRMGHRKEEIKAFIDAYQAENGGRKPDKVLPAATSAYEYCHGERLEALLARPQGGHSHGHAHAEPSPRKAAFMPSRSRSAPPEREAPQLPQSVEFSRTRSASPQRQEVQSPQAVVLRRSPRLNPTKPH